MPTLNDYLGSLVSSVTNARVMSDIQTVKVAEEYAKHDLLKHFSVPRMRIGDVEMTIPIALDQITEKTETEYEPIDNVKFNALVYKEVLNNLGVSRLSGELSQQLRSDIANKTVELEQKIRETKDLSALKMYALVFTQKSLELEGKLVKAKTPLSRKSSIEEMPVVLEYLLAQEIKPLQETKSIDQLNVIAESHRLREQKPENIVYIKLKITEDGMEWNRIEHSDGEVESKLLPE